MLDDVLTIDRDTGKVPDTRIKDVAGARTIVGTLKEADELRAPKRAKIQGMLDGNPPFSPKALRDKGQGHRTNFNTRDSEGMRDSATTPYYGLVFSVPRFAEIVVEYGDNVQRTYEWGESMSKAYHYMLDAWKGMDHQFQLHHGELVVYGIGPLLWRDSRDWRSFASKIGKVLVPDNTPADVDELETMVVLRSISPGQLYAHIKDEKPARAHGWNVKAARQAIIDAAPETATSRDWEYYQSQIRSGDVTWDAKSKMIFVADLYQKEFDGKVSHYILLDTNQQTSKAIPTEENFLFKKIGRFTSFHNIISPFFFDTGTGNWHSIKGMGPKIYDCCDTFNQLTCAMVDGAKLGAGVLLQAPDANAVLTTQIIHIGGAAVIGPGYVVQQTRIAESLQGPLAVKRDLQGTLQSNTGQYRQRVSEENQEPTLGQAQMNAQQQARLGEGASNRYYNSLDLWHEETLRRALKMGVPLFKSKMKSKEAPPLDDDNTSMTPSEKGAFKFIRDCVKSGVPLEVLDMEFICSIKATRAVGYGSLQMQEISTNGLLQMLPMLDERGRNAVLRRRAALLVGQANVDSIVPSLDQLQLPGSDEWQATQENNALRAPLGDAIITPEQNHPIHFVTHYKDIQTHEEQFKTGQSDPQNLLIHLEQAGPHMTSHMQQIAGDPTRKQMVAGMQQILGQMGKEADDLKKAAAAAMQASAGQNGQNGQQPDPAVMKVQGDLELKRMKTEGDMTMKAQKQAQTMRLKDIQTAENIRLKKTTAAADHDINMAKAAGDHNVKAASAAADANLQAAIATAQIAGQESGGKT